MNVRACSNVSSLENVPRQDVRLPGRDTHRAGCKQLGVCRRQHARCVRLQTARCVPAPACACTRVSER
eukprot:3395503-Pleurochrysis_carterae.AAC.1